MLKNLYIKDYALIDELRVKFGSGLNILTGETGTGKSIIIGALSLLLGERTPTDVIRQGAEMAIVEGLFNISSQSRWKKIIEEKIDLSSDELLLRREIHRSGRSRAFANDSPITNTVLSTMGDFLIDLHGQHTHQTLLNTKCHLDYLDNFGLDAKHIEQMGTTHKKFKSLIVELAHLKEVESGLQEKRELFSFQVQEIEKINPREGEEASLETEDRQLSNCERLIEASRKLKDLLYDAEGSVSEKLSIAENAFIGLSNVDTIFKEWGRECESARIAAEEVANAFQAYVSKIDYNPSRLEEVRERLGHFHRLKIKYGGDIEQVLQFLEKRKKELEKLETVVGEIDRVANELEEERKKISILSKDISDKRGMIISDLTKKTVSVLEELGLGNAIFHVVITQQEDPNGPVKIGSKSYKLNARGIDSAEFFISLNPGESPKPLAKIASGGEISRIMLALKSVLAEADEIPILVFDEIDSGISGRIARVVGKNLKEVSKRHQVICITHLPQIASLSELHFCVEKEITANRTRTTIRPLNQEEKVVEIAKLIGGDQISESTLQSARELLDI